MNTKKCPHCAHDKTGFKTVVIDGRYEHRVMCLNCGAYGPNEPGKALAVASWNERREMHSSVQVDADAYEHLRNATPEELLEAVAWYYLEHELISALRFGFQLAQPGGWRHVAPHWLRESRKIAALDVKGD